MPMNENFYQPENDDDFIPSEYVSEQPQNGMHGCLKGCLIAFVVALILAIVAGWYISRQWRGWVTSLARTATEQSLKDMGLDEEQQKQAATELDRVFTEFEEGRLTEQQFERLLEEITQSPLTHSLMVKMIEKKYFDSSGLNDDERDTGCITLRRFFRGMFDGKLTEEDSDAVLEKIATQQPNGDWELRESVSDEELRDFLDEAKSGADAAKVPETVEEVDVLVEIKQIVDAALSPEELNAETGSAGDSQEP